MSDQSRSYAERAVIYVLLGLAAVVWFGFGSLVFVGILQNTGA
jgi:hypothetical protein